MNEIMERDEFLVNFADQFEDTDPSEIRFETKFHNLVEWSSLTGMMLIAMAKVCYNKTITGDELKECVTVEDVYTLINEK